MPSVFAQALRRWAALAVSLSLLLSLSCCGGGEDDSKGEEEQKSASFGPTNLDSVFADAKAGVFRSCPPAREAGPKEKQRAKAVIEYAEKAESFLFGDALCARIPKSILLAARRSEKTQVAPYFPERPDDDCMRTALAPSGEVFGSAASEMQSRLKRLDTRRMALQQDYGALYVYMRDEDRNDGGEHGRVSLESIEAGYAAFERERDSFLFGLEEEADKALDVLLRTHPLRLQIHCANLLLRSMQRQMELLFRPFVDDALARSLLGRAEVDLRTSSRFPFPLPGESEMAYRRFLGAVETAMASCRAFLAQEEGTGDRRLLEEAWGRVASLHGEFLDAADRAAGIHPAPKAAKAGGGSEALVTGGKAKAPSAALPKGQEGRKEGGAPSSASSKAANEAGHPSGPANKQDVQKKN